MENHLIKSDKFNQCNICGESSSTIGWHYGVVTCQACKVSFIFVIFYFYLMHSFQFIILYVRNSFGEAETTNIKNTNVINLNSVK
jgi:hypothetical protein